MAEQAEPTEERRTIDRILAGETHLFHELIRPHERTVYVMALSFLHNESDAEDVAQEAFLKAFRNLAAFRGEAKFGTWLISITLNEARSRLRRNKALPVDSLDTPADEDGYVSPALLRDWKEIPSEQLERHEVKALLQRAIQSLPGIYKEVLILRDVEELSTGEAAEVLKVTIATVKVRLHRARTMMQKLLAPELKKMNPKRRWFQWS